MVNIEDWVPGGQGLTERVEGAGHFVCFLVLPRSLPFLQEGTALFGADLWRV